MRGRDRVVKKEYMYLFVFSVTILHFIMLTIWLKSDMVDTEKKLDINKKEYENCKLPNSEHFSTIINLIIIIISSILSYSIRDVKKEFKEPMAVPVYIYLLFQILVLIINAQSEMSLLFKDFIQAFGSQITVFVVLYNLYIIKFHTIFFRLKIKSINSKRSINSINKSGNKVFGNPAKCSSNQKSYGSSNRLNSNNKLRESNKNLNECENNFIYINDNTDIPNND